MVILASQQLRRCTTHGSRFVFPIQHVWSGVGIKDAQVRKPDLLEQYWAAHKLNRIKFQKPSTLKEILRTVLTLHKWYSEATTADPEVVRELMVIRLDYIMIMCALFCTKGKLADVQGYFPGHRDHFRAIIGLLQPETFKDETGSVRQAEATQPSSGPCPTMKQPTRPAPLATSPCPGVSKELYDKIQAMRVPPGSTSGLESIVGCAQGKRMIQGILLATIDRPKLAEAGELENGVLLHGPPGTGKTSLVLAAASKPNGPTVYLVSSAAMNDQYHGNSEKNIAALYAAAAHNEPAIIFIDEIESLCGRRAIFLTALMTAMRSCPSNVVSIGASSLPSHIDESFRNRLSLQILVPLSSEEELASIWELKLSAWPHSLSHDEFIVLGRLIRTYGLSGRDIEATACRARQNLNRMVGPSPSYYRAVQNNGKEYLYACSADDPAACAVNGRAEISTRIHGRPTSLDDLVAAVEDLRSNLVHDD